MSTCWFYSHRKASVHGHEILKIFYLILWYINTMTIIITSGGFNYAFSDIICTLFVFLYDTLMMVAEETETCR